MVDSEAPRSAVRTRQRVPHPEAGAARGAAVVVVVVVVVRRAAADSLAQEVAALMTSPAPPVAYAMGIARLLVVVAVVAVAQSLAPATGQSPRQCRENVSYPSVLESRLRMPQCKHLSTEYTLEFRR